MLPIGGLYGTYHLLREPETTMEHICFLGCCHQPRCFALPPFELFFFDLKIPGAEISTQAYAETLGDGAEKSIGYLENATEKIGG